MDLTGVFESSSHFLNDAKDLSFITCILKSASKYFQVIAFLV